MNPLRRVLLGDGRLPERLRAELTRDGLLLLEEGLAGSITRRGWRAPREYANWRKEAISGAIAITHRRLLVWGQGMKQIDVPLAHPLREAIEVAAERPDRVRFGYEASRFDKSRSGRVEVRLRTAQAYRVADLLKAGWRTE